MQRIEITHENDKGRCTYNCELDVNSRDVRGKEKTKYYSHCITDVDNYVCNKFSKYG